MAFREILKILPSVDGTAMNKMFSVLNNRFKQVSKKFGKGMMSTLKGGGILGAVGMIANKLMDPLKEANEQITGTLDRAGQLTDYADQFGTTSGNLFKLTQLAASKGIDPEQLYQMIQKFQSSIVDAQADPNKDTSVRAFVGTKDFAEGFYRFIQNMQSMSSEDQTRVQQEVFGEKAILRMAAFLRTDFAKQERALGLKSGDAYTPTISRANDVSDLSARLTTRTEGQDFLNKANATTAEIVRLRNQQQQRINAQNLEGLKNYEKLQALEAAATEMQGMMQEGLMKMGVFAKDIKELVNQVKMTAEDIKNSKLIRGIFGGGK